jgi:GT2 family glycosyltransferase
MDASIIIPIYRRTEWITQSLSKLQEQDFNGSFEIILVDDGSPNEKEIEKAISGYLTNSVKYIKKEHAGPAAARNHGAKHSSGEILCFIDDDSIPERSWLNEMICEFSKKKDAAVISGRILSYDRKNPFPLLLEKAVYPGRHWATCNIAYRREIFEKLGGFDETFPEASWEDNDLGLRARWAGYSHIYNTKAIVYHNHEKTMEEYKRKCLLNGRGAAVFSRKYLFKRPFWGIGTPIAMSRRLVYGLLPPVWKSMWETDFTNESYLKFIWSFYSLKGFMSACKKHAG